MLSLPAYFALGALLVAAANRWCAPIPRRSRGVLLLLPLLFVGGAMLFDTAYAPADIPWHTPPLAPMRAAYEIERTSPGLYTDISSQIAPWRFAVYRAWRAGEWPLWNPAELCGDPLAGTAQPAPFYPFVPLTVALPFPVFLTLQTALAFLVAALAAWLFFADLGVGELAALVGAAGWAFSSFVAFWIHWPMGVAVGWFPLVLLGARRVVRAPGMPSTLLLAVALACALLAGHPETAVHLVFVGALWALLEWAFARFAEARAVLASGIAAGVLALGLAAIGLLPILEALPQSFQHDWRKSAAAHAVRSVPWPDALQHLVADAVPFAFGVPGAFEAPVDPVRWLPGTAYVGSVLFPLAIVGLARRSERRRWGFAAMAVVGMAAGVFAPGISEALAKLPFLALALNERLAFAGGFGLVGLAVLGVAEWQERADRRLAFAAAGVAIALAVALLLLAPGLHAAGLARRILAVRGGVLIAAPALVGTAAVLLRRAGRRTALAGIALLLLLAERRVEIGGLFPLHPADSWFPRVAPLDRLAPEATPYRVVGFGYALVPAVATYYGLEDPRGYQALTLRRLLELHPLWSVQLPSWFNRVDDLEAPLLDLMNVRYAIAETGFAGAAGWELAAAAPGTQLLRNREALERAFVPQRLRFTRNGAVAVREMSTWRNFAELAWIDDPRESERLDEAPREERNGRGQVLIRSAGAGYRLAAEMEEPGWVIVTVAAWNGWHARSDGRELPLAFGDHAFLAVQLPAGKSDVELFYRPVGFVAGAAISGLTLVGLLVLGWTARRRRAGGAG